MRKGYQGEARACAGDSQIVRLNGGKVTEAPTRRLYKRDETYGQTSPKRVCVTFKKKCYQLCTAAGSLRDETSTSLIPRVKNECKYMIVCVYATIHTLILRVKNGGKTL